jgi:signal transduction histidine kinase
VTASLTPVKMAGERSELARMDARSPGGSGLGLAIVTEIASAHGGTVRVGERAGGGALVQVELAGALGDDDRTHPD